MQDTENPKLKKIRHFQGTWQDFHDWLDLKLAESFDEFVNESVDTTKIIAYINAIAADMGVEVPKIIFTRVGRGGACVQYTGKVVHSIQLDMSRLDDWQVGVFHELAHVILIRKEGYAGHGAKFTKLFNQINDTYMYSEFDKIFTK